MTFCGSQGFAGPSACVLEKGHAGKHKYGDIVTAEADQLRLDAERYRLLRRGQHWSVIDGIGDTLRSDDLDAAIDAAMKTPNA
jgi:hypothetical protein